MSKNTNNKERITAKYKTKAFPHRLTRYILIIIIEEIHFLMLELYIGNHGKDERLFV